MFSKEIFTSPNAQKAFERGLFTPDTVSTEQLKARRFDYSAEFFQWLCKERYLLPSENHHAVSPTQLTPFYHPKSIDYAYICLDLKALYDIYLGNETIETVVHKKGVSFVRIMVAGSLLGLKTRPVTLDCVTHQGIHFWSKQTAVFCDNGESRVISWWDNYPADWQNPNTAAIFRMIAAHKEVRWQHAIGEPQWQYPAAGKNTAR